MHPGTGSGSRAGKPGDTAKLAASTVDHSLRKHPWYYVGGAAVGGLLIGLLINRRGVDTTRNEFRPGNPVSAVPPLVRPSCRTSCRSKRPPFMSPESGRHTRHFTALLGLALFPAARVERVRVHPCRAIRVAVPGAYRPRR